MNKSLACLLLVMLAGCAQPADDEYLRYAIPPEAMSREVPNKPWGEVSSVAKGFFVGEQLVAKQLFYYNGKMYQETLYKNGRQYGMERVWHSNGQLQFERPYKNGLPHGLFKQWDSHGKLLGAYRMDGGSGVMKEWYENGTLKEETPYEASRLRSDSPATGSQPPLESIPHGMSRLFFQDGKPLQVHHYQHGKAHGLLLIWDEHGKFTEDTPQFFLDGKQVSQSDYDKAAATDPSLPRYDPKTTKPTTAPATLPAGGLSVKQRQAMLVEAVNADPIDYAKVRLALADVGNIEVFFSKGPLADKPDKKTLPADVSLQYWNGKHYLAFDDGLNRKERGASPQEWMDRLTGPRKDGYRLTGTTLFLAPTDEIVKERDRLLKEADAKIRKDLLALAAKFPRLTQTIYDGTLAEQLHYKAPTGGWLLDISVRLAPDPKLQPSKWGPGIWVRFKPLYFYAKGESQPQAGWWPPPEMDNLALEGDGIANTDDAKMDAAANKIIDEALAPLKELNKKAAILNTGETSTTAPTTSQPSSRPATQACGGRVKELIRDLRGKDPKAQLAAIRELGRMGSEARPAMPALATIFKLVDNEAMDESESLLAKLCPVTGKDLPWLIEWLSDDSEWAQWDVLDWLCELGPAARPAIPFIVEKLKIDSGYDLHIVAARALREIGPDGVKAGLNYLMRALKDKNPRVRHLAADSLHIMGKAAKAAVPDIQAALCARYRVASNSATQPAATQTAATTRPAWGRKPFIARLKAGTLSIEPKDRDAGYPDTFRWRFLPAGSDKWIDLEGIDGEAFIDLDGILISPDEKYLAMLVGAGDPPTLEVVDIPTFLKDKKLKMIRSLDTYPGGAELKGWKDGKLLLSSRMQLTENGPCYMSFAQDQTFTLDPATGRIEAVSEDARNPARAMLRRVQAGDWDDEYAYGGNSLDALVYLKAVEYRDDLRKLAAAEPDAEHKAQILAAVGKLDQIAHNPATTSRPATAPASEQANPRSTYSTGQAVEKVSGGWLKVTRMEKDSTGGWKCTFLPDKSGAKETLVTDDFPGMSSEIELSASPNGKCLAVWSMCEGCYGLTIMDLPLLLKEHKVKELAGTGAWLGGLEMGSWKGQAVVVKSRELLTPHPNRSDMPTFLFPRDQEFLVDAVTGKIAAGSADARNPIPFFTGELSADDDERVYEAANALTQLRAVQSLPTLRQALAKTTNKDRRESIQKAVRQLEAATQPAVRQTSPQAIAPATMSFRVEIREKGYAVSGRQFKNAAQLVEALKKIVSGCETSIEQVSIVIAAGNSVRWHRVVEAFNLLAKAGFKDIAFASTTNPAHHSPAASMP